MQTDRVRFSAALLVLTLSATLLMQTSPALCAKPPVTRPLVPLQAESDATTLEDVLERALEAAGGRGSLNVLSTRVMRCRIVTDLAWDPPVHEVETLTVYSKHPDRYLIVHRSDEGTSLEGCDGTTCWKRGSDAVARVVDPPEPRSRWLTDPRFAARLDEHFPGLRLIGIDYLPEGRSYVAAYDDVETHRLSFDSESGLLVRLGFNRELRDYREFDGVLLPARVAYSRKGGSSVYYVESVDHNVPLDDALFAFPGAPARRPR